MEPFKRPPMLSPDLHRLGPAPNDATQLQALQAAMGGNSGQRFIRELGAAPHRQCLSHGSHMVVTWQLHGSQIAIT